MKKSSLIIGLIVIFLEIFVFNFSFIKSMFYEEIKVDLNAIELSGIKKVKRDMVMILKMKIII